ATRMEFRVLNGRPWIHGKRKSSVEFNCRLISKQRVPGRVLPGSSYRVKNWSRLRPVARSLDPPMLALLADGAAHTVGELQHDLAPPVHIERHPRSSRVPGTDSPRPQHSSTYFVPGRSV